jgi:hypothetical protein
MRRYALIAIALFLASGQNFQTALASAGTHPWDVNGDGIVDPADVLFVTRNIGNSSAIALMLMRMAR